MSRFDHRKYQRPPRVTGFTRTWPEREITRAPIWVSEDLRDGNQALLEPMTVAQKQKMWKLLMDIGIKEVMIGFPSASQHDYDFVRWLIEEDQIPDDVTIAALTQCRDHLIDKTFESLEGVSRAIIHLYNSTSTIQRERVFEMDQDGIIDIAVKGTQRVKQNAAARPGVHWRLEYSPESFSQTETDFAVRICEAVMDVWGPTPDDRIIFNLPNTVEQVGPHHHADQIEYFCQHIKNRDSVIVSVHTHNDRGGALAAAELAMLAGAERVEGCLLGNGERTGNMDIVVLAMNLYGMGVDPELDLSDPDEIIKVVHECTGIPLHPRHPWVGELVYTAFSGSHQDAIRKSLRKQGEDEPWQVAYLPIDPRDIGRDYQAVIRVNSQSGKGGMAFLLERDYGINLPRWMMLALAPHVQRESEKVTGELGSAAIRSLLFQHFDRQAPISLVDYSVRRAGEGQKVSVTLSEDGDQFTLEGQGNGPLSAFVHAWNEYTGDEIAIADYAEHALSTGSDADAIAFVQLKSDTTRIPAVAEDADTLSASMKAIISAINLSRETDETGQRGGLTALAG
ncbi:2-isopropylmalate synthase [Salinisphaera hydrothermalis]|uniref:2-isopropylmalate synthase n=1 Tax=Salinisphaera hydrothermalis (strain C41B8) TaxID=1304275 RepID=A0A084IPQ9_SALHC|nr:2-isopropylmalate synthase [Salinisphaera hydrothermalis]KEZ78693.1 2-isopropylmalate synthase [Salinisphaera hydrothermalis C41B8]